MRPCLVIFAAALAGCQPAPRDEAPDTVATPSPAPTLEPIATLAGEWRVAGIDGEPLDESYGLALIADEKEIWWEPRCAGMIRGYTIDGLALATGPRVTDPPASTSTPAPVCLIARPPRLNDVARALQTAERVGRTPENGVLIEGGGHSVTLFSQ